MRLALTNLTGRVAQGLAILGLLTLAVMPPQTASAHYVFEEGFLYRTHADCVKGRSEVSHGTGKGYSRSDIFVKYNYNGTDCMEDFDRPSGYIKVRQHYYTHLTPGWANCRDTGWIYSTSPSWFMTVARTHNTTCGSNWEARTLSHLYQHNSSWRGGPLYSGNHNLPY